METTAQPRLDPYNAFKLYIIATLATSFVWMIWDEVLSLIIIRGHALYWWTGAGAILFAYVIFQIYMIFQLPAVLAIAVYQLTLGRKKPMSTTLRAFPVASAVASILTVILVSWHELSIFKQLLWALPPNAAYGFLLAILRKRALGRVQRMSAG